MTQNLKYYLNLPYRVELNFEPGDNSWVATHPELGRGSCYAISDTKEKALKLLEEEKKSLLEFAIKEGKAIPEPDFEEELPSGQFVLRLPRSLHKNLKEEADKENISLNQLTVSVLSQYVGAKGIINGLLESQNDIPTLLHSNWELLFQKIRSRGTWASAQFSLPVIKNIVAEQDSTYDFNFIGISNVEIKEKDEPDIDWRYFPGTIQKLSFKE